MTIHNTENQPCFPFSRQRLKALRPTKNARYFFDACTPCLQLRIRPDNTKTFLVMGLMSEKLSAWELGDFPELTLSQARQLAIRLHAQMVNQYQEKQTSSVKSCLTLSEAFEKYLTLHAKIHKKNWRCDKACYQRYLMHWGNQTLSHMSREALQQYHAEIGKKRGIYAANRVMALLRCLFNKMILWGWSEKNPVLGVTFFKEHSRDRFLQPHELPKLFKALKAEKNTAIADYVQLSLLTGARKHNVLAMRWKEIDWTQRIWRIPMTKNGYPHLVPLVPAAVTLLQKRFQQSGGYPFVFPGYGQSGHLCDPKKGWARICRRANLKNLRLHDLRRSTASWMAVTGASLPIIGKTLAHRNPATTAIYARLNVSPVREAMEKATHALWEAAEKDGNYEEQKLLF